MGGGPRSVMATTPESHAGGPGLESQSRPTKVWSPNAPIPCLQVAKMRQGSFPRPPKGAMWDGARKPSTRDYTKNNYLYWLLDRPCPVEVLTLGELVRGPVGEAGIQPEEFF